MKNKNITTSDTEEKFGILDTIIFTMRYYAKHGSLKDLLLSNVWLLFSALAGIEGILNKLWIDEAKDAFSKVSGALTMTLVFLGIVLLIQALESIFSIYSNNSQNKLGIEMHQRIDNDLIKKAYKLKAYYFDTPDTFDMFERTRNESYRIINAASCAFGLIGSMLALLSNIGAMLSQNIVIMLIAIAGCIPLLITQLIKSKMNYRSLVWQAPERRRAQYMFTFMITRGYFMEMRMLGFRSYMMNKYNEAVEKLKKYNDRISLKFAMLSLVSAVIRYGVLGIALWMTVVDIMSGKASIGGFALVFGAVQSIQGNISGVFNNITSLQENSRYVGDYVRMMKMEDEDLRLIDAPIPESVEIEFDHVTFSYPGSDRLILKDFSLKLKNGEKVAIVGENGAGKSTFVALLLGLYQPNSGEILINGKPLDECLGLARRIVSCAIQKRGLYETTMANNVRMGDAFRENVPFEDIAEACRKTGFDEVVETMQKKYDTIFGYHVDNARDLSGGEAQKMINSRALLRRDARVLVLDEPTAALDPVAEAEIYKHFNELTGDKSCILISHRLGVTTVVDRVVVIDDGHVIETGTHDELLRQNGLYSKMWNAQAKWYAV